MAGRLVQIINSMMDNIENDLNNFTPLKNICDKYNIKVSWIFIAAVALTLIFTLIGLFQHIFVTVFAMLYPAYMSFKAINQNSQQKSKYWLTYWIVFGFITAFDKIISIILFFLPGYYTFKILFFLWMFYPRTNGAQIIYQQFLKPQLQKLKQMASKYHNQ